MLLTIHKAENNHERQLRVHEQFFREFARDQNGSFSRESGNPPLRLGLLSPSLKKIHLRLFLLLGLLLKHVCVDYR